MLFESSTPAEVAETQSVTTSWPVLHLPWFIRCRLGLASRFRIPFGRSVRMKPWESTFMLADERDISHVLVTNDRNYVKTPNLVSEAGQARAGRGLLTSIGDRHHSLRRGLQPVFRPGTPIPFVPTILRHTRQTLDGWRNGQTLNVAAEMTRLGLNILVSMIFGDQYKDEGDRFSRAVTARRRYNEYVINGRLPFRTQLPTPTVRRYRHAIRVIDDTFFDAIRAKRHGEGDACQNSTVRPTLPLDLLSMLLDVTLPDGTRLTDQQLRDELLTLTTAGYETVSDGLTWTLLLLAMHPQEQMLLQDEVSHVLGERTPAASDFERLPRTLAALSESWRLYPPTWIYVRTPLALDALPSGVHIPARARLYLCPYVMHRHPHYFPDPEKFNPSRFTNPDHKLPRGVYFPFGDGPHICIGAPLAKMQSVLMLASIVQRFQMNQVPGRSVTPYAGVTLRPRNGAWIRLRAR